MQKHLIQTPTDKNKSSEKKSKKMHRIQSNVKRKEKINKTNNRTSSSKKWLERHINDPFVQQAKIDGLISRAAYKLMEINDKYSIIHQGQTVVDLGAAPGGWIQFAWNKIRSKNSKIIAVDLLDIDYNLANDPLQENVKYIKGDFTSQEVKNNIQELLSDKTIDVILSDMSPNTTGFKDVDHFAILELANQVINFAEDYLRQNGNILMKVFEGEETRNLKNKMQSMFDLVSIIKPAASRKSSKEIYILGKGFKHQNNAN